MPPSRSNPNPTKVAPSWHGDANCDRRSAPVDLGVSASAPSPSRHTQRQRQPARRPRLRPETRSSRSPLGLVVAASDPLVQTTQPVPTGLTIDEDGNPRPGSSPPSRCDCRPGHSPIRCPWHSRGGDEQGGVGCGLRRVPGGVRRLSCCPVGFRKWLPLPSRQPTSSSPTPSTRRNEFATSIRTVRTSRAHHRDRVSGR